MMINRTGYVSIFCVFAIITPLQTYARSAALCGDVPPVSNETLKGEIKGKAQLLTRYLGDAELSGEIETSRSEIFSKYPDAEKSRSNAFFEYQVCVLIMTDNSKTSSEKLEALKEVKREFGKPIGDMFNVVFRTSTPFIDNRRFGPVDGSLSTIEFKINGKLVTKAELDKPFGSHSLKLPAGDHSFEFIGEVYGSGNFGPILESNCMGTFTVSRSETFTPQVVLAKRGADGHFSDCSLSPM